MEELKCQDCNNITNELIMLDENVFFHSSDLHWDKISKLNGSPLCLECFWQRSFIHEDVVFDEINELGIPGDMCCSGAKTKKGYSNITLIPDGHIRVYKEMKIKVKAMRYNLRTFEFINEMEKALEKYRDLTKEQVMTVRYLYEKYQ